MKTSNKISGISLVLLCCLTVVMIIAFPCVSRSDPSTNIPICTADGDQDIPQMTTDGSGGAIIVWEDDRDDDDLYAQRINASGETQWANDGVLISDGGGYGNQTEPRIISDGSGGAFIVWKDSRDDPYGDIYAQRINASGVAQWTANGVVVCDAFRWGSEPELVADGSGGVIITWQDDRDNDNNSDIYAQKLDGSGVAQWTANGVLVCNASNGTQDPMITSDGSGGAIIAWADSRTGARGVYAQRLNSSGVAQWTANGVGVSTVDRLGQHPKICGDGSGGVIIAWYDDRFYPSGGYDIYAQRLNNSGTAQWTANGVVVSNPSGGQEHPELVGDGSGGAFITWIDERSGDLDIYAQHLNSSGTATWTSNGVAVCTESDNQNYPQIINDGAGGVIMTWYDYRGSDADIYAQRLNSSGVDQWTEDGELISSADEDQEEPQLVSDGSNGAMIAWYDYRNDDNYDIYAQRVFSDGSISYPTATFTSANQQVTESAGTATITAQLSDEFIMEVTVPFTLSGSATEGAGQDYTITASPLVFSAGETVQEITVSINDDSEGEGSETVIVTMGTPTNAESGETTVHTLTITDNDSPPTVTTTAVSDIYLKTASSGGNVTSDGGSSVTARGVCWSESENPTTGDTCTSDGSGTGSFTSFLTNLRPSRIYHVRAYATNANGTSYGNDIEFRTRMCMPPIFYILLNP